VCTSITGLGLFATNRAIHGVDAGSSTEIARESAPTVRVVVVERGDLKITEHVLGRVERSPLDESVISTRVGGVLTAVMTETGTQVTAGSELARLHDPRIASNVRRAEANLAASQARLDDVSAAVTEARTEALRASFEQSSRDAELARTRAGRRETLAAQGLVSTVAAQEASSDADRAEAAKRNARWTLEAWIHGGAQRVETIARAERDAALVDSDTATLDFNEASIRAPVDGIVTKWLVREGEILAPGDTLGVVARQGRLRVRAAVASSLASRIQRDADVWIGAADGPRTHGSVNVVEPDLDSTSGLVPVVVDVDGSAGRVGEWVRTSITIETIQDALLVPESALRSPTTPIVLAVVDANEHVRLTTVELRGRQGGLCAITGIEAGSRVIVDGAMDLEDDCTVVVE
jgi:multidrug efflux pump subunit AcrA (membrane-fusion protein)